MPLKVWNGSTYSDAQTLRVWNGSSWVSSTAAHVWNGSAWVKFFPPAPTVSLGNHSLAGVADDTSALSASIYFVLNSSGMSLVSFSSTAFSADVTIDSVSQGATGDYNIETWLDSGLNSNVSAYVNQTSGSTLVAGSDALNTYLNLGTTRQWGLFAIQSSIGSLSKACTLDVSLVEASNTSNVLDTATITLSVQVNYTT